jgi:tetratricopeptide (TPR) repeat protein
MMTDPHASASTSGESSAPTPIPGTTIRFFISSTFVDFQTERNVLQKRVFPELRQLCAASGFRLQPIDLRWGVSEAAGTDRQTLRICFDELERCRKLSPDCFLLILLGERYGSYILPPQVPATLIEQLLSQLAPEDRTWFHAAYQLDENAVPPEYVLLGAERPERAHDDALLASQIPATRVERLLAYLTANERRHFATAYRLDESRVPSAYVVQGDRRLERAEEESLHQELVRAEDEVLRQALVRAGQAAGAAEAERLLFEGSATHREIQLGLLGEPAASGVERGVLCAVRTFTGAQRGPDKDTYAAQDAERANRVQALTAAIRARLPPEQVRHYGVPWDGESGPVFDEKALAEAYLELLRPKLVAVIAERTAAREAAKDQGQDEMARANSAFALERAVQVEGREAEQARLRAYLAGAWGAGPPLVVTGPAGSGKSTLLADAVTQAAATQPQAALVTLYIGVTPGTGSLTEALTSLRSAIALAYDQRKPEPLLDETQSASTVAAELATLAVPPERPLLLVLDALDQLGPHTQRTDWLPPTLPPNVRVVVSILADRAELGYLSSHVPAEHIMTLAPLDQEAGRALLHQLLAAAPARTLTPTQEQTVLAAFAPEGLPLHLRLVVSEARRWRSFDLPQLGGGPLPKTIPGLLDTLLTRLEGPGRYGPLLVARSLGDLAAAQYGLAEDELLAVLAQDHNVRADLQRLSEQSPRINPRLPLPVALWARLYAEVAPLLTERERDEVRLFTFYHQQLRQAVEARYLRGRERVWRHRVLAAYFASQPWQRGSHHWNWRKMDEQVAQQERAGQRAAAGKTLNGLMDELEPETAETEEIRALTIRLADHLLVGGHWRVAERFFRWQLAMYQQMQEHWTGLGRAMDSVGGVGGALANLGELASDQGRPAEAARYLEQALDISQTVGDRAGEGQILGSLGNLTADQGRPAEAAKYYEQALAIAQEVGDRTMESNSLHNLGGLASNQGRLAEAARYLEQALAIAQEVGDWTRESDALHNLGVLASRQGRPAEAASYYEQALAIAREVGYRNAEATILNSLGLLASKQDHPAEAARYLEQALAIAQEVGERNVEGQILGSLGNLTADQGRPAEAAKYYEQALAIRREVGDRAREAATLRNLGALAANQDHPAEAARYLEQALAIYREVGDLPAEAATLDNLGNLTADQGRPAEAAKYYEQALAIRREVGDRAGEGTTLNNLGLVAADQGHPAEAGSYHTQALAIHREVGDQANEGGTLVNLGDVASDVGRPSEAKRCYTQALRIFEAIGDRDSGEAVQERLESLAARRFRRRWWPFGAP